MSLILLYLGTRYDVYGFITSRDIFICLFYVTFDLHLWPTLSVKVTFTLMMICILCCWMFVPKMKSVGSVEFGIWTFVYIENLNNVTMTSSPIWFQWNSHTNLQRAYVSGILNFSLSRHKIAEINIREFNRELWRKWVLNYCDLDLWPNVTNFNSVCASNVSKHLAKIASKSVHPFGWNFVQIQTHTNTNRQTNWCKNITNPRFRGIAIITGIIYGY